MTRFLILLFLIGCSHPERPERSAATLSESIGPQKVLILQFTQTGFTPASPDLGRVVSFWADASHGASTLDIEHHAWTVPVSPCGNYSRTGLIEDYADAVVDFSQGFRNIVFIFTGYRCGEQTKSGTAASDPFLWHTDEGDFLMYHSENRGHPDWVSVVHELLHTYGLIEGNRYTCGSFPVGFPIGCDVTYYGDSYTVMGLGSGHPSPGQSEILNWVTPIETSGGTYTLGDYQTTGDCLKVVRNATTPYFLSNRGGQIVMHVGQTLWGNINGTVTDPNTGASFSASGNTVTVTGGTPDLDPPTGVFTAPAADTVAGIITASVDAPDAFMVRVRDSLGRIWGEDYSAPFSVQVDTRQLPDGSMHLVGSLWDSGGNWAIIRKGVVIANNALPSSEHTVAGPVVICPQGDIPYTVQIRDTNNVPMPGKLAFLQVDDLSWCDGTVGYRTFTEETNGSGEATFWLQAEGMGRAWLQVDGQFLTGTLPVTSLDADSTGWGTGSYSMDQMVEITPHVVAGHVCP